MKEWEGRKYSKSPSFNHKLPFDNQENIYLRWIEILKQFQQKGQESLLEMGESIEGFRCLLNKLEAWRGKVAEFQIIAFLCWKNSKKLVNLYLKLRKELLMRCTLNTMKFNPVAIHNPAKYFQEEVSLNNIMVDYEYWGMMV